jgi:hypothetical protein
MRKLTFTAALFAGKLPGATVTTKKGGKYDQAD